MTDSPLHLGYLAPSSQEKPSYKAEIREDFLGALSRVLDELSGLAETLQRDRARCFEVLCMRRDGPDDTGGEVSRRGYVPTGTALSPGTRWKRKFTRALITCYFTSLSG